MPVASAEIVWKGNNWSHEQREYVQPGVIEAIGIAESALRDFELETALPSSLRLYNAPPSCKSLATCLDNGKVDLRIPRNIIMGHKMKGFIVSIASSLCHEAVHDFREQVHPGNYLMIPRAADEGLAHTFESMMAGRFMSRTQFKKELKRAFDPLDARTEDKQRKAFRADARKELALVRCGKIKETKMNSYYKPWFEKLVKGSVPKGEKLGIMAVGRHLSLGVYPRELLQMPADEIMDMMA